VEATLEELTPRSVTVRLGERRTPEVELDRRLHVAVAVLKGEKLDWVVQKLTELGARQITLLHTERTIVAAGEERWVKRLERYQRIAREATEQSGRVRVPDVAGPLSLAAVLNAEAATLRLFLDPLSRQPLLKALAPCPAQLTLLIGPEGGFTEAEAQAARDAGAVPTSLGPRVLRAETAALAAATLAAAAE